MVVMSIPIAGRLAFISREGNYLNLYNNFTLFTVLCLVTYRNWLSLTSVFFCLQLEMIFKVVGLGHFGELLSFFWMSNMYTEGIHVIQLLLVFLLLICLFITGKSQPRIKKSRGKIIFFSPTRVTRQLQLIRKASIDVQ